MTADELMKLVNRYVEACDDLGDGLFEKPLSTTDALHAKATELHRQILAEVTRLHAEAAKSERRAPGAMSQPATPAQAEELAKRAVGEYMTACGMTDRDQIGNYLMKLVSAAGVLMAQAEGSKAAAERLSGTAAFVFNNMPRKPATLHKVQ
jgi:hypothetical protein